MSSHAFFTVLRWIAGGALLWGAWYLATQGQEEAIDLPRILLGAAAFLVGMILLWPTLFHVATRPFLSLIDLVFSPGERLGKPLLNLKLPMHYLNEERYDEAAAEYLKILKHYPREAEAYEKMIWIESQIRRRPKEAIKWLRRAKRRKVALDERIVRMAEWTR